MYVQNYFFTLICKLITAQYTFPKLMLKIQNFCVNLRECVKNDIFHVVKTATFIIVKKKHFI